MQKTCQCGAQMDIRLRTVIYSHKVEIANVPVFQCGDCKACEVYEGVKSALTGLIKTLGSRPAKGTLAFEDYHELAYLLRAAMDRNRMNIPLEQLVEDRINQLLDLMLLAKSLGDSQWLEECRRRLKQIASEPIRIG